MTYSFTCQLSVLSLDVQILYTFLKTFNKLKNKRIKLKIKEPSFLPKKINKITLLKSPHINKKSKEQFEIRKYKAEILIKVDSFTEIQNFLQILRLIIPLGLTIKFKIKVQYLLL